MEGSLATASSLKGRSTTIGDEPAHVLLVEDDPIIGRSVSALVRRAGYRVDLVTKAEVALDRLRVEVFNVVVSDVHLPGMSGVDLLAALRTEFPQIPAIMISGEPSVENVLRAMEHGALQFLRKPVRSEELLKAIERAVELVRKNQQTESRYRLLGKIASGGMGTVYLGRAKGAQGFRRFVAIKRAHPHLLEDPTFREMLIAEARLASQLHHPNVVAVNDVEEVNGDILLIMDYVEGAPLSHLLSSTQPPNPSFATSIVLDTCEALDAIHSLENPDGTPMGVVHRDVSPQNILVGADGVARLTDFGVAKHADLMKTSSGLLRGKPGYMAPEYITTGKTSSLGDVFGLGVVAWESLTHQRLFRGQTDIETIEKVRTMPIAPPSSLTPEVPPAIDAVILKSLARDPDERYQSSREFASALSTAARAAGLFAVRAELGAYVQKLAHDQLEKQRSWMQNSVPPPSNEEAEDEGPRSSERGGTMNLSPASSPEGKRDPATPALEASSSELEGAVKSGRVSPTETDKDGSSEHTMSLPFGLVRSPSATSNGMPASSGLMPAHSSGAAFPASQRTRARRNQIALSLVGLLVLAIIGLVVRLVRDDSSPQKEAAPANVSSSAPTTVSAPVDVKPTPSSASVPTASSVEAHDPAPRDTKNPAHHDPARPQNIAPVATQVGTPIVSPPPSQTSQPLQAPSATQAPRQTPPPTPSASATVVAPTRAPSNPYAK